jgi:hypothetical protein
MPANINEIINRLPAHQRTRIAARSQELIREEMTRQELRRDRERTQTEASEILDINEDNVSRGDVSRHEGGRLRESDYLRKLVDRHPNIFGDLTKQWRRLSGAQRLRARGFWWEGVANTLGWLALAGVLTSLSLPLLQEELARHWFRMAVLSAAVICFLGQYIGLMRAKRHHERADSAETLESEAEEEPAKLLRPESHLNEPGSE